MVSTELFSAGSNAQGQLAQGTNEDSHRFRRCIFSENLDELSSAGSVLSVAAGANHTLVLSRLSNGMTQLWGCGDGRRGQLGDHYRKEFGTSSVFHRIALAGYAGYEIIFIAASWETSFVALSHVNYGDVLLSMGSDDFGDLGIGSSSERKESGYHHRINFSHILPNKDQSLIRILELQAGPHNAVVLLSSEEPSSGSTKAILTVGWGASRHGQLGPNKLLSKPQPYTPTPTIIQIPDVRRCAVGNQHIVFLSSIGSVVATGSDRKGQISHINSVDNIREVGSTWNGTYLVRQSTFLAADWCILATGSNSHGQLGRSLDPQVSTSDLQKVNFNDGVRERRFQALACGSEHILVLLLQDDENTPSATVSEVWGWGWNEHGNLGLGHTEDVLKPALVWDQQHSQIAKERVNGIWAGCGTSWIAVEIGGTLRLRGMDIYRHKENDSSLACPVPLVIERPSMRSWIDSALIWLRLHIFNSKGYFDDPDAPIPTLYNPLHFGAALLRQVTKQVNLLRALVMDTRCSTRMKVDLLEFYNDKS